MKRVELEKICEQSLLNIEMWSNKFSFIGQKSVCCVYKFLTANINYFIHPLTNSDVIAIEFLPLGDEIILLSKAKSLSVYIEDITPSDLA